MADPLSRNPSHRPAAVLHALPVKLNVTTRGQAALQTSGTPFVTPTPTVTPAVIPISTLTPIQTPNFTFPTLSTPVSLPQAVPFGFATSSAVTSPSDLAADTVIPADTANEVATQPTPDRKLELQRGYQTDAWFLK